MKNNPVEQATRADWKEENINKSNCVSSQRKRSFKINTLGEYYAEFRICVTNEEHFNECFDRIHCQLSACRVYIIVVFKTVGLIKSHIGFDTLAYIVWYGKQIANCHFSPIFICFDYLFMTATIEKQQKKQRRQRIWRKIVQRMDFCRLFVHGIFFGDGLLSCVYLLFSHLKW